MKQLQEKSDEAEQSRRKLQDMSEDDIFFNTTVCQNQEMKASLTRVEKTLLDRHTADPSFLGLRFDDTCLPRKLLPTADQPRFYVRTFGVIQDYEAHELGLSYEDFLDLTQFSAFDQGNSISKLTTEAVSYEGKLTGFIEQVPPNPGAIAPSPTHI